MWFKWYLRGKVIALNVSVKNLERLKVNELNIQLKTIGKETQISERKQIIKKRTN